MKRLTLFLIAVALTGCARPGELGYTTSMNSQEHYNTIARNWDWEGKQVSDDMDELLMLRPMGHLTLWNMR